MIPVFIGYDPNETVAFHVCANSIIRNSSKPVAIIPLALNLLSSLYTEHHTDGSNQFIYSRFLVPYLMNYTGWAIYIDGDMIVTGDIAELWDERRYDKDVLVVKHDYKTKHPIKYLGANNQDYPRKNWSSVIIWNCSSDTNKNLTPSFISNSTGAELHRFTWIKDQRIGEISTEWNWLVGEYDQNQNAKLYHYTVGIPAFSEYHGCDHADIWHDELQLINYCKQHD